MLEKLRISINPPLFLIYMFLVGLPQLSFGADDFIQLFDKGIKANQAKEWDQAITDFSQALSINPNNTATLNNLAHSYFQKGKKGKAISFYRKALFLHPEDSVAQSGLKYALSTLEIKEIPHQIETFEILRDYFLTPVSIYNYLWLTLFAFFCTAWLGLQYMGEKTRNPSHVSHVRTLTFMGVFTILTFIFSTLLGLKYLDVNTVRGTLIEPQTMAYVAPGENQVEAFTLYEGLEVIVRMEKEDWLQVTYPGGPTGWIKRSSIIITTNNKI